MARSAIHPGIGDPHFASSRRMEAHVQRERWRLLHQLVRLAELPMAMLGVLWMVLLAVDMVNGLHGVLSRVSQLIWLCFAVDFGAELLIAPKKWAYLKRHWPVALSLALPALRIIRFVRVMHVTRAATAAPLATTLAALNRSLASLRATLRRRGFAYMVILTIGVILLGAAAVDYAEQGSADPQGIHEYGTALWWTAMLMTTLGPPSWPTTIGGRLLCVVLGLYAFTIFGYVTATLATFFIDRDAERPDAAVAGERSSGRSMRSASKWKRSNARSMPDCHRFDDRDVCT
jgi:voltage-gated potassium channel